MNRSRIEICVESPEDALAAQNGGAHRVELCSALSEGGITPSAGSIIKAIELIQIDLNVIIRPRRGDFLYSDSEFGIMKNDIEFCKNNKVNGVVSGILREDGSIDKQRTGELIELSKPMSFTFHRAFDCCKDPYKAINELIALGADRILTSGLRQSAIEGQELIKSLVEYAENRIIIMPGSGIRFHNISSLQKFTEAKEFHASAKEILDSKMKFRNENLSMTNNVVLSEYQNIRTKQQEVEKLFHALNQS